jgi:hypothetical protein
LVWAFVADNRFGPETFLLLVGGMAAQRTPRLSKDGPAKPGREAGPPTATGQPEEVFAAIETDTGDPGLRAQSPGSRLRVSGKRLRRGNPDGTIEMHIISFGSDADFQNYRNDPRRTAQARLLEKSSAKSELLPMANVT